MYHQLIRQQVLNICRSRLLPATLNCPGTGVTQSITSLNNCNLFSYNSQHNLSLSSVSFKDAPILEKIKQEISIEKVKQELSVFKTVDLKQLKCAPYPAILYGFGGIIPFIIPPVYFLIVSYSPFLATSQLMYGATILAFVGGVKWGNALAKEDISHEQIGKSTIPSLVAWSALLLPEPLGFLVLSTGLIGALYMDLVSSKYPPWFNSTRLTLTSIAVTSLMISFFCQLFH